MSYDPTLRTVHLGQFSREEANRIAADLEEAGIVWYVKEPGVLARLWEFGVRLFVDKSRLDEAKAIVRSIEAEVYHHPPDPEDA